MASFEEQSKNMSSSEILNLYRNFYYTEPNHTEKGIVANAINEILPKYTKYIEAEQKGHVIIAPCKIGDIIYKIPSKTNFGLNIVNKHEENNRVYAQTVWSIQIWSNTNYIIKTCDGLDSVLADSYRETWFLSEDEANFALAEMGKYWNTVMKKEESNEEKLF